MLIIPYMLYWLLKLISSEGKQGQNVCALYCSPSSVCCCKSRLDKQLSIGWHSVSGVTCVPAWDPTASDMWLQEKSCCFVSGSSSERQDPTAWRMSDQPRHLFDINNLLTVRDHPGVNLVLTMGWQISRNISCHDWRLLALKYLVTSSSSVGPLASHPLCL